MGLTQKQKSEAFDSIMHLIETHALGSWRSADIFPDSPTPILMICSFAKSFNYYVGHFDSGVWYSDDGAELTGKVKLWKYDDAHNIIPLIS